MTRIVALGDSISFGVGDTQGVDVGPGWSGRLALALGSAEHQRHAWPGARLTEMLQTQLPATLIAAPDIALVSIGGNDAIRRGFNAEDFTAQLQQALLALREFVPTVVTLTLPDISRTCQIPKGLRPHLHHRVALLNAAIRNSVAGTNTLVLDRWKDESAYLELNLASDRVHPSPAGYQSLARATATLLDLPADDLPIQAVEQQTGSRWWVAAHGVPWAIKRSALLVPSVVSMLRHKSGTGF